jgi:hypothetical protein
MYSCQQDHIICDECLRPEIASCPICRQDFHQTNPQRSYLAERLVRQHLESPNVFTEKEPVKLQVEGIAMFLHGLSKVMKVTERVALILKSLKL